MKLRDANVIQEQLPEDIALHHMDERTNSAYEMTYPENNNGVVSEGGHEKEEVSSAEHNDDENRQVIVLEQGDSSTVEKAQHSLTGRPNESSGDDGGEHTLVPCHPMMSNLILVLMTSLQNLVLTLSLRYSHNCYSQQRRTLLMPSTLFKCFNYL